MFVPQKKIASPPPLSDDLAEDAVLRKLADEAEDRWVNQFIDDLGRFVRPVK